MEMVGRVLGSLFFMAVGLFGCVYMWNEEKGKGGKWYECLGAAMISYCFLFLPGFFIAVGKGWGHFWWFEVPKWVVYCVMAPGMVCSALVFVIFCVVVVMGVWEFLVKFFGGDD